MLQERLLSTSICFSIDYSWESCNNCNGTAEKLLGLEDCHARHSLLQVLEYEATLMTIDALINLLDSQLSRH